MLRLITLQRKHKVGEIICAHLRITTLAGLSLIAAAANNTVCAHAPAQERIAALHAAINFEELQQQYLRTLDATIEEQTKAHAQDTNTLCALQSDIAPTLKKQWNKHWQKSYALLEKSWNQAVEQLEQNEASFAHDQQFYTKGYLDTLDTIGINAANLYHSIQTDVKKIFSREPSWLKDDEPNISLGTSCSDVIQDINALLSSTKALHNRAIEELGSQHMHEHVRGVHVASLKSHVTHANLLDAQLQESTQRHASNQSMRQAQYKELKQKINTNIDAFIAGFRQSIDQWIKDAPGALQGLIKAHQYVIQRNKTAPVHLNKHPLERSIILPKDTAGNTEQTFLSSLCSKKCIFAITCCAAGAILVYTLLQQDKHDDNNQKESVRA